MSSRPQCVNGLHNTLWEGNIRKWMPPVDESHAILLVREIATFFFLRCNCFSKILTGLKYRSWCTETYVFNIGWNQVGECHKEISFSPENLTDSLTIWYLICCTGGKMNEYPEQSLQKVAISQDLVEIRFFKPSTTKGGLKNCYRRSTRFNTCSVVSKFRTQVLSFLGLLWVQDFVQHRSQWILCHGGYPGNRNVRYASHNMADAQGAKNRHVYFSIKTAFNKMI